MSQQPLTPTDSELAMLLILARSRNAQRPKQRSTFSLLAATWTLQALAAAGYAVEQSGKYRITPAGRAALKRAGWKP